MEKTGKLKRTLGPIMLWGLGVGYVISGMYFGWNLGLAEGGTLGLALATGFIIVMYLCFTFSYTELACAMPKAGGAFTYARRALGDDWGFVAGMAQNVEFIFAPPAIAFAIGAYLNIFLPDIPVIAIAIAFYIIFTCINIRGVEAAASLELVITGIAVVGLLVFVGSALPHVDLENLSKNALPHGWAGAFAAIPFAIWFFLAIEGVANVAEETVNPQRNILVGFGSAIVTLVVLCLITFCASIGVEGWEAAVYPEGTDIATDSPLPLVLEQIYSSDHLLVKVVSFIGLFGLVASFHGIILAAGRATFEFGREGFAPPILGKVHPTFHTPHMALVVNMGIGFAALFTGKTGEIITIACFGALSLYIVSMISILVLRRREPNLERPFKVPGYPVVPAIALIIASISLIALVIYNPTLALIYLAILLISYVWYRMSKPKHPTK